MRTRFRKWASAFQEHPVRILGGGVFGFLFAVAVGLIHEDLNGGVDLITGATVLLITWWLTTMTKALVNVTASWLALAALLITCIGELPWTNRGAGIGFYLLNETPLWTRYDWWATAILVGVTLLQTAMLIKYLRAYRKINKSA